MRKYDLVKDDLEALFYLYYCNKDILATGKGLQYKQSFQFFKQLEKVKEFIKDKNINFNDLFNDFERWNFYGY